MNVIEVEGLSKDYRQHFWTPLRRVLDKVSFEVKKGEIFGFLGPNGSGKTTTIKLLFQIIFPTEGSAKLFGKPLSDSSTKKRIGFLPENSYFYEYLTSFQFLQFHGRLVGMEETKIIDRMPEVLKQVGMIGTENIYLRNFSKGMLQRIGLAQAIIHNPDLIILDEPMTGLDPVGRKEFRELIIKLRDEGKTVFFSTHILSDVESVCDRVAILNKGKLVSCGTLKELVSFESEYIELTWRNFNSELVEVFKSENTKCRQVEDELIVHLFPIEGEDVIQFEKRSNDLVKKGHYLGATLVRYNPKENSLEDVFIKQVGKLESRV